MNNPKDNFNEIIAGHFHDILKASGVAMMRVDSHEKIRDASRRMALSIEHKAEQEAIKVFKRLQGAVEDGFNTMEADIKKLKEISGELIKLGEELSKVNDIQTVLLEDHSHHLDILNQYGDVRIVQEGDRKIPSIHKGPNPSKPFVYKERDPEMGSDKYKPIDPGEVLLTTIKEVPEPSFDFEAEDEGAS